MQLRIYMNSMDYQTTIDNLRFHRLMGILLEFFLQFFRGLINSMVAPIFENRCVKPPKYQKDWLEQAELEHMTANRMNKSGKMILEDIHPQPLAIYSLNLVATYSSSNCSNAIIDDISTATKLQKSDAINQMDNNKNEGVDVVDNFIKQDALRELIDYSNAEADLCCRRTFCYFFVDVRSEEPSDEINELDKSDTSQKSNDSNNNSNELPAMTSSPLQRDQGKTTLFCRQRSISECSEDSFICFLDNDDEDQDEDADADADDDEDEDEDDETDECDLVNDQQKSDDEDNCSDDGSVYNKWQCCDAKKVRFNLKPEVHVMHTWDYAYRSARKGEWQVYARDRARFQQRIQRTATYLDPVLSTEHRRNIYASRFADEL